jgi:hypothetical protein
MGEEGATELGKNSSSGAVTLEGDEEEPKKHS